MSFLVGLEIVFVQVTLRFFVEKNFSCVSLLLFGGIFLLIGIVTLLQDNDFTTVVAVCIYVVWQHLM